MVTMDANPLPLQCILAFTSWDYSGNNYGDYAYPGWANSLGWCITFSSVICIPVTALVKILRAEGSLGQRIRMLCMASNDWGPKHPIEKKGEVASMPHRVDGSAMTLLPNTSCIMEDGRMLSVSLT